MKYERAKALWALLLLQPKMAYDDLRHDFFNGEEPGYILGHQLYEHLKDLAYDGYIKFERGQISVTPKGKREFSRFASKHSVKVLNKTTF